MGIMGEHAHLYFTFDEVTQPKGFGKFFQNPEIKRKFVEVKHDGKQFVYRGGSLDPFTWKVAQWKELDGPVKSLMSGAIKETVKEHTLRSFKGELIKMELKKHD